MMVPRSDVMTKTACFDVVDECEAVIAPDAVEFKIGSRYSEEYTHLAINIG